MPGRAKAQWFEGPILEDVQLASAVLEHWTAVALLVGEDDLDREPPADVESASQMVNDAAEWLAGELEAGRGMAQAARLLAAGQRLASQVHEAGVQWRARAFAQVHAALGRLRAVSSVQQLMEMAPQELGRCGFDRAMLSRVEGSVGIPQSFYWVGDPDSAKRMIAVGQQHPIKLTYETLESEMVRRRGPLLVLDPQNDPRAHRELSDATQTRRYVAAPVMPQGRVIGFFHADCHVQQRLTDEFDRDLLWMFAEGFGYAYERTILVEKLRSLRQEVRRGNQAVLAVMDEFCDADVLVAPVDRENAGVARSAAALFIAPESRLESLLTRRELDVIRLMAAGETNAGIARKLVVSEGTVKSHVKHILRKLRASNRAEAVSRFIRLSQQMGASSEMGDE